MKLYASVLVCVVACGGTPVIDEQRLTPAAELALLESLPAMDGASLPPRADSPRTVVMFFASW